MANSILPGVPHISKAATTPTTDALPKAPKVRQNMLNIRVSPLKRMMTASKPLKPEKFGFTE